MHIKRPIASLLALAMVLSICLVGVPAADASVTYGGVTLQFGDPEKEPTWPENVMSLEGSGGTYTAVYGGSDAEYYYPDTLSLYADCGSTSLTLTGSGVKLATYADAEETLHDSLTTQANGADLFTLKLQSAGTVTITGGDSTVTILFSAPKSDYPAGDATPTAFKGYLPVGQYASGAAWGSPYSDGSASVGSIPKVVGGYSATGISLGAAGGYVEYDMDVTNSDATPYGVDFVVYGNAFVGNPEAASVKVYGTPVDGGAAGWYELAGSLYYADETLRGVDVTYKKVTSDSTDSACTTAGIWYKISRNGETLRDWTKFNSNTAVTWWPEESEGYLGANGVWGGVDDVVVSADQTEITYQNVTLVRDTDATADYGFGYADVTPNGSSYGTPVNPYVYNTSGGNAFDISWAVDDNGESVRLSAISKIRVYTSAALDVSAENAPIFTVPATFGETSAEVCGIYAVTEADSGAETASALTLENDCDSSSYSSMTATLSSDVTPASMLTLKNGDDLISHSSWSTTTVPISSGGITIISDANYIWVDNKSVTSGTTLNYNDLTDGQKITIKVMGTAGTYVTYLLISKSIPVTVSAGDTQYEVESTPITGYDSDLGGEHIELPVYKVTIPQDAGDVTFATTETDVTTIVNYDYTTSLPLAAGAASISSSSLYDGGYNKEIDVDREGNGGILFTSNEADFQIRDVLDLTKHIAYLEFSPDPENHKGVFGLVVQIGNEADTTRLQAAVDSVPDSDGYYTENDCWNGKSYSANGFWQDMQSAYQQAEALLENSLSARQDEIDSAAETLEEAIGSLIPTTQVNATGLYEAVQAYQKLREADYTEGSWAVAEALYGEAAEMLSGLFDENGAPTEANTPDSQSAADELVDQVYNKSLNRYWTNSSILVEQAYYNLYYETYTARGQEAQNLLDAYDPARLAESDYTEESWTAYTEAYAALKQDMEHVFAGGIWADYWMLVRFETHLDQLISTRLQLAGSGDVTFSFTYVNNVTPRYPSLRDDTSTELCSISAITLPTGSTSLADALDAAGITYNKGADNTLPGGTNTSDEDPFLVVYFDGEYVTSVFLSKLADTTIQIPNGAQVKAVRCVYPAERGEASSGYDTTYWDEFMANSSADYSDSFALIGVEGPAESVAVGEKVVITGTRTGASYAHLGEDFGGEGLTLFVSEPSETETLSAPTKQTTAVTGADGTLEYVFAQPGWYTVALFDLGEDVLTATDVYGATTIGSYPSLYAGDFTLVHVTEAENGEDLLEQYRAENLAKAEAYFQQFHDYDFAEGYYETTFQAQYNVLVADQNDAETFEALMSVFEDDFSALQELAANVVDHASVLAALRADMAYLPDEPGDLDYTYEKVVARVREAYNGLNSYQRTLLTQAEIDELDALLAYVEAHPEYTETIDITVTGPDAGTPAWMVSTSPGWLNFAPHHAKLFSVDADGATTETFYSWRTTGSAESGGVFGETGATAHPGYLIELRRLCYFSDENYQLVWSVDGGATWELPQLVETNDSNAYTGMVLDTFRYTIPMDDTNETIAVRLKMLSKAEYDDYVADRDAAGLADVKTAALAAVQATYESYDQSKYDADGLAALQNALADGTAAINAATTNDAVAEARKAALAAMASVPRASSGSGSASSVTVGYDPGKTVGQVHVLVENQTYTSGLAGLDGVYVDGWYDLGEKDTMMTVILKALRKEGYAWNGTRGTVNADGSIDYTGEDLNDYTITYISEISYGTNALAEFDGGAQSGWMGTLNDWFTNEGFAAFSVSGGTLENGDELRVMYTRAYGADIGSSWSSTDTSLAELTVSSGVLAPSFDGGVTEYTLVIPGDSANVTVSPVPVNKNYQYRIFLNSYNQDSARYKRTETISVRPGDTLYVGVGESGWPTMNADGTATKYVIYVRTLADALAALPAAGSVTAANYATYQKTAETLRALVTSQGFTGDLSKLEALEEKVTFYSQIDNVKALLADIPAADRLTAADKSKVEAAKSAYDLLSDEQRLYITEADVAKYNAAIEWLETQGVHTTGGTITGSTRAPEETVSPSVDTTVDITIPATVDENGEATATVGEQAISDALAAAAKDENAAAIVITPEVEGGASKVTMELTASAVKNVAANSGLAVTVNTGLGSVTISNEGLTELAAQADSAVTVSVEAKDDAATEITLAVDGKAVERVSGALAVALTAGKDGNVLVVVNADGSETIVKKSVVDGEDVKAILDGSCTVKIISNSKEFDDVTDHWAGDGIDFVSSHELFHGTGSAAFTPDGTMTRGMMATVLYRLEDAAETGENAFADVPAGTWYNNAVTWAEGQDIVKGYSAESFGPNDAITREQLATMLYRYAASVGMDTSARGAIDGFSDSEKTSSFAVDAERWAVGVGLLNGKGNDILDPAGPATRAEVAVVMQRLVKLLVQPRAVSVKTAAGGNA